MTLTSTPPKPVAVPINGLLLLNKPQGLSSNAILQRVKRLFGALKAGHTGSLDPMATGMLPICFGEATKFSQYLLDADKVYCATGQLGIKTTTADAMGEVVARATDVAVTHNALQTVLADFMGESAQVPSMFSALKHHGVPLYRLAREGITIERAARTIHIQDLRLLAFDGIHFDIEVRCSKGTYIRNLVEDIGERLGVYAHVTRLHRVATAGFEDNPMYDWDALSAMDNGARQACLLSVERLVIDKPTLHISTDDVHALQRGQTVLHTSSPEGLFRLMDPCGKFIGLGTLEAGVLRAKRLLAYSSETVIT